MPDESSRYINLVAIKKDDVRKIAETVTGATALLSQFKNDKRLEARDHHSCQVIIDRLDEAAKILYDQPHPEVS